MRAAIRIAARVAKVNVKPGAPQDKGKPLLRPATHPIARVGQDAVLKNDGGAAGIWNAMNSEQETVVCLGDQLLALVVDATFDDGNLFLLVYLVTVDKKKP